jgi:hypothetical protein
MPLATGNHAMFRLRYLGTDHNIKLIIRELAKNETPIWCQEVGKDASQQSSH